MLKSRGPTAEELPLQIVSLYTPNFVVPAHASKASVKFLHQTDLRLGLTTDSEYSKRVSLQPNEQPIETNWKRHCVVGNELIHAHLASFLPS